MQETEGIIERVWQLSPALQRLELTVEPSLAHLKAGQSLLALTQDRLDPYLREHWIPVERQDGQLVIERAAHFTYTPGQVVRLMGAIGTPIPWQMGGHRRLLLWVHDASPIPILLLAQEATQTMAEVALVLTGTAVDYPFAGIPAAVEVMTGAEDGTWEAQEDMLLWADRICTVVNPAVWFDQFSALFQTVKQVRGQVPLGFLYGLFNLMPYPCGTGVCAACMIRCKTSLKLACTQGPALDLAEVLLT